MSDIEALNQRVAGLEQLLHEKLGVRGRDLAQRLRRAGRQLPKRVQMAGRQIVTAQRLMENPKLARLNDPNALNAAFGEMTRYLNTIDPADRRRGIVLGIAGGVVFNLLVFGALLVAFMRWHGGH